MAHQLEPLVSGYALMEGPRWDGKDGLYFCDSLRGGIYHHTLKGETRNIVPKRKGVGGIMLHADGGIVVSGRDICHVHQGVSRVLLELGEGARFNDIFCDRRGRPYVGTLRFDPFNPDSPPTPGELYRIEGVGEATQIYHDVGLTNGIGFSPDERVIYHSDSLRGHILAHTISDNGTCIDRRVFAALPRGAPDGLCVDTAGGVWVAAYGAACIMRFTPDGRLDRDITIPAKKVTSLCFGDADMRTLYITTADNQLDASLGACLFCLRVDVAGLPPSEVRI
ncbi:MAG: 6-deoxy-6-sulfogluconolactonase [Alphaproteobacteria bacterium]|nr:MAG: 6-deoxy-6-sulfogluconolactonase [Alphaproteobacteria bacterium]